MGARLALGELDRGGKGVGGFDFHVRLDTNAFPVVIGIGIDGALFGNAHAEVVVDAMEDACVGSAARGFADEGGAMEHFEGRS
jgi:hypothetical protein